MMSVGRVAEVSAMTAATAPKSAERVSEEKTSTLAADHTDKFVKSGTGFTPAYTKAAVTDNRSRSADQQQADDKTGKTEKGNPAFEVKSVRQTKNEAMKDMVAKLLGGQASSSEPNGIRSQLNDILKSFGLTPIESDDSEDFWGAEKTANRILDFAKSLAGDDEGAFETLKNAFETAFGDSEKIWGGKLPEVSYKTYDLVKQGFDDWEKEIADKKAAASEKE